MSKLDDEDYQLSEIFVVKLGQYIQTRLSTYLGTPSSAGLQTLLVHFRFQHIHSFQH